ncbi:MAG: hypothetical protein E6Q93_05735 [Burkholderiaceae bacterium]|nr:MAG: hypothetical protein E6Q93_05735 [Burkholderiaceae bacterium]
MTMKHANPRNQRGVVLITTLLILVVMLIGAVALVRSFDTSMVTAGNLSFKRDLAQQSELAVENILSEFRTGGPLGTRTLRGASDLTRNYSARVLAANPQGIPLALLTDTLTDPQTGSVIGTAAEITAGRGIRLRYVVDRQCSEPGDDSTLGAERCTLVEGGRLPGGSSSQWQRAEQSSGVAAGGAGAGLSGAAPQYVVYRISIRAFGPRGTESFYQTTYGCCDD